MFYHQNKQLCLQITSIILKYYSNQTTFNFSRGAFGLLGERTIELGHSFSRGTLLRSLRQLPGKGRNPPPLRGRGYLPRVRGVGGAGRGPVPDGASSTQHVQ